MTTPYREVAKWLKGFNSLRTGRIIQTNLPTRRELKMAKHLVSIPYEREGSFRLNVSVFPFDTFSAIVSIPYEREGSFRRGGFLFLVLLTSFQFPTNGKDHSDQLPETKQTSEHTQFQFPTNGKDHSDFRLIRTARRRILVSIPYEREGSFRLYNGLGWGLCSPYVSIPYEREGSFRLTPFSTQTSRGSKHPKTKHELRGAFFCQKFNAKTPQTLINIDPNAIFQEKPHKPRQHLRSSAL